MTVAGDAGGPVGSAAAVRVVASWTEGGGDSDEGVPELDIVRDGVLCVLLMEG